jgi:crotonobetainyl-CoA:carnitine CoA-transferase CaiB-like acyl-CoA transferase
VANTPVKLSRTPGGATRGASRPGEHTAAILRETGLSDERIEALIARGIAWTGPEADPDAPEAAAAR